MEPLAGQFFGTPGILYLTSVGGTDGRSRLQLAADGSELLTFQLPNDLVFREPHSMKLLGMIANSRPMSATDPRPALVCLASFAPLQALFGEALPALGTSVVEANVYQPLAANYLSASGRVTIRRLDGEPIDDPHDNLTVIIHLTPTRLI